MLNGPDIDPDELFAIDLPVMVIAGTKDVIKKKHTKLISDSIWGSKLVFLKGDHYIASKNCAKFNRTIEKFLNS
jgi:pimeloyl-ACP methyl ester carboxylesterase